MPGVSINKPGVLTNRRFVICAPLYTQKPCTTSIDSPLQSTVCYVSKPRDDRRRPAKSTPAFTIPFSEQDCCNALSSRPSSTSLRCSGQRGLHEVYTASHDASVERLVSYDILRVYTSSWRSTIELNCFKSAFSVKSWAYCSASSLKEVAIVSCLGPFLALSRVNWGC